jgi:peroxiredoxin
MSLTHFSKRTPALLTVLVVAVLAVAGLLGLMSQLAVSAPPTPIATPLPSGNEEPVSMPSDRSTLAEAVATVNDEVITQKAWQQATRLDAVMSQLAAQPIPTAEETLDRLINEIIVLQAVSPLLPSQPASTEAIEARIQTLETNWQVTDEMVITALAEAGLERSDLTARVDRLLQVEAALSQLETQEDDLTAWLVAARASAEIGLYRSLVDEEIGTQELEEAVEAANSSPQPPSTPAPQPIFAPPPEMAVSPYPQNAAPDFTLSQLEGGSLTLSNLRGKPTLINFWATWCPPCRRELPALQTAYTAYQDDIGFIAVNVKEDPATVTALVQELGLNFPIVLDSDGQVSNIAYEVRGLPTTVFVDANGVVVARHIGPLDEAAIEGYLKPLLEIEAEAQESGDAEVEKDEESPLRPSPLAPLRPSAPDFTLTAANGAAVSLQDFRGKSNVALVFYRGHT